MNLGLLAHNQSAYSRATDFLQEGMAAARSLHDDKLLSAILINKAVVLYSTGDHPEAEAVLMNALTLAREVGHNTFLIKWMTGSPTVSIELVAGVMPIGCPDCLIAFMSGWTKYSLENNYSKNKIEGALAGAEHAIEFYSKNKSALGQNADMEKLIKQKSKDKLKKYIESKY
jgi:tetratricopeptide (TPR) repeat protein